MAQIKVIYKQNGVAILLPGGSFVYGDPDGDFVAEEGSLTGYVNIKRSINNFYVVKGLYYTDIKDENGNTIGTSGANCVSLLNSNYFNPATKLSAIDDVSYQNSNAENQFLKLVDVGGGTLRWSNEPLDPNELLTAIKTVDGSGSGLDADNLDGLGAYQFLRSDAADTFSGKLTWGSGANNDAIDLNFGNISEAGEVEAQSFFQYGSGRPRANLGYPTVTEMALFEEQFTCKTGLNNDYDDLSDLTFWTQATSSSSWVEESVTDDKKRKFLRTNAGQIDFDYGTYKFRVEFHAKGYTFANAIYGYFATQGHNTQVHVWKKRCSDGTWIQHTDETNTVASWPGHLWLPFNNIPWHETNTTSDQHFTDIRIEFTPNWNATYSSNSIRLDGLQIWGGYPTGRRTPHSYDSNGKLTTWGDLDVSGEVSATGTIRSSDYSNPGITAETAMMNKFGLATNRSSMYLTNQSASGDMHFGIGNLHGSATKMYLSSAGRLGIGTTSPSTALDVNGVVTATGGTSTDWNTAYGWGNHASAGYLTSETTTSLSLTAGNLEYVDEDGTTTSISLDAYLDEDARAIASATLNSVTGVVTFTRDDSTTFTLDLSALLDDTNLVTSVAGKNGVVTLDADDISDSATKGIPLLSDQTNWDTAYGWGNHASAGYISNLAEDTTPQLGGNLDVNGNSIVSASNGHIAIMPNGTGKVGIGTTSPSRELEVNGGIRIGANETIESNGGITVVIDVNNNETDRAFTVAEGSAFNPILTVKENGNVGIGTASPISPLHVYQNDTDTGTGSGITIEQDGTGDAVIQFLATNSRRWVAGIDNSDGDRFKIASTSDVGTDNHFQIDGNGVARFNGDELQTSSDTDVTYGAITTTQNGSIVRGGFMNPAAEANMVHLPHIVNDLAGFQHWGTITTSGLYKTRSGTSGSYTYSNEVAASDFNDGAAFDGYSSHAGSWYSDDGVDGNTAGTGVITLEWSEELRYSAWAGIVFGANNFTATRVKIEAYRGGAWQTLCDITDNTDQVVMRQIGSNSGAGSSTTKLRYTLGGSVNNSYFRIHTLYAANYRAGDNNLSGTFTDKTRGVHYLEKYKNNYAHGDFYPADTNTYNLGSTSLQWNTIYSNGGNSSQWNTAYGWGNHASAGYISNVVEDTTPQLGGTLDANGNTIDMGTNVITDTKVGQWDTAYGWGNHASAGYLTSETSHADVVVDGDFTSNGLMKRTGAGTYGIVTDNSSNWDTAYGWGNHASAGYISNLSEDTTPQLGGNLDVNGSSIVSASNGHISLMPNGTGKVGIGTTSPSAKLDVVGDVEINGQITINDEFNPYTLPAADGTSGQVLQTNGSGTLSFVTPSSGVTASGTPVNNQLAVWTTASEIEGDNNLTWTGTQFNIAGGALLSADLIKMNGRAPTSPSAGEVGVGGNVITQFHTSGSVTAGGVYVAGSSAWVQADADAGSTATGLLAVATDAASPAEMLIEGSVKLASNTGFSTASKGDVLYLSLTAGELTSDISGHTTGDFVRVCGYVIDASKNYVYFKPDNTWLEL